MHKLLQRFTVTFCAWATLAWSANLSSAEPTPLPPAETPTPVRAAIGLIESDLPQVAAEGGLGPFIIESRESLSEDVWCRIGGSLTASPTGVTVSNRSSQEFFRTVDIHDAPPTAWTAFLSGANERPEAVPGSGSGLANLLLERDVLSFEIHYSGLSGPANAAHIHGSADADNNAGVILDLAPYSLEPLGSEGIIKGSVALTDSQRAALVAGQTYLNLHTAANPAGEIRGQIAPAQLFASLSNTAEKPVPTDSAGAGMGSFSLIGNQFSFRIDYFGLTGPATAAHIHGPAGRAGNAGVMIDLAPFSGDGLSDSGSFIGTVSLDPEPLRAIVNGQAYVNIHTAANGAGEIRGQINPMASGTLLTASLSGARHRPLPIPTDGIGFAHGLLDGDRLVLTVVYDQLTGPATAAHIHGPANTDENAAVMIDLEPVNGGAFGQTGVLRGSLSLNAVQQQLLLASRTYINIHTEENGAGEIRGQLNSLVKVVKLNGESERPIPVLSSGSGLGVASLIGNTLHFALAYSGLSETVTAAHIHGAATPAANADVAVDLSLFNGGDFGNAGVIQGMFPLLLDAQFGTFIDGLSYLNFHTEQNPAGEIRGQVVAPNAIPVTLTSVLSGEAERPTPVATSADGSGVLSLAGDQLHLAVDYFELSGPATAAHIHGRATSDTTAQAMIDLEPLNGGFFDFDGTLAGQVTVTPDQRRALLLGETYLNIHTEAQPAGEIRGQIGRVNHLAQLSGQAERPTPIATLGQGTGRLKLIHNTLWLDLAYGGLTGPATAAHIHGPASPQENAAVLIDLQPRHEGPFAESGRFTGSVSLESDQLGALIGNRTYFNIHTEENGSGEIRGQITSGPGTTLELSTVLHGDNQRPTPVQTDGKGSGSFSLNGDILHFSLQYSDLSGAATAFHIHGPADTESTADVWIDLEPFHRDATGTSGTLSGILALTPSQVKALGRGTTYVNIHTANHPSGEIRGQIKP